MTHSLMDHDSPEIARLFTHLEHLTRLFKEHAGQFRPILNGERYLTEAELANSLKLTQRTLIEYRNTGKLPYYKLGGRVLYKERDIIDLLERNKVKAFKR